MNNKYHVILNKQNSMQKHFGTAYSLHYSDMKKQTVLS